MFLQNTSAQYAVGIKGGLNICNYWGTDLNSNYQTKFAPVFGLMARYQKNQTFSFLAELNYDMRGANYDEIIDDGIIYKVEYQDINKAVNYISLPLYAKWGFGQKKLFYGIAGLYGAVAVSANIEGIQVITNKYDPYDVTVIPVDADIKDNVKSFDMGALIGLGMDFKLGTAMDLMFDCRYNWGWLNTAGQGQGYVANTDWAFNLGLLFNLRKKNTE
jgi:opacity protein-like surface antigen